MAGINDSVGDKWKGWTREIDRKDARWREKDKEKRKGVDRKSRVKEGKRWRRGVRGWWEIKWQRKRGSLRDFFSPLLSSEPFWLVHLCYILGKRDETECESRENAVWHYSSLFGHLTPHFPIFSVAAPVFF